MRRFRLGAAASPTVRRFRLPAQKLAPMEVLQPKVPTLQVKPSSAKYEYPKAATTPARNRPARGDTAQTTQTAAYIVKAPVGPRKDRRQVGALLASDSWMPGPFGPIRLRMEREAVDLSRVAHGNLPAHIDHDPSRPFGRIVEAHLGGGMLVIAVEVANTPDGDYAFESIQEGTRGGWSPGYHVAKARVLGPKDQGFDAKQLQTEVVRHMPVEGSLVSQPMNSHTRTLSTHRGGDCRHEERHSHRHDRLVLQDGKGRTSRRVRSADQRKRLAGYCAEYDKQIAAGMGRYEAAMAARAIALA